LAILITGAAGFIGFHVAAELLARGERVIGIDNLNDYYDVSLKEARLAILNKSKEFLFYPSDISDRDDIFGIGKSHPEITKIIHLAAQAGVRYSLENPFAYVASNLVGQVVMLELCRNLPNLQHFIYASSSSVYGSNKKLPFSVSDNVDTPLSLYAATKKSDELLTHSYSHLFGIRSTGLRFFTVYGPWGRPDMATYIFTKNILEGKPIKVFNNGEMKRDFTYIDDIVGGIVKIVDSGQWAVNGKDDNSPSTTHNSPYKIYNLGNHRAENLMYFINILEEALGKKAIIELAPMHPGDVKETYADIADAQNDFGFAPKTPIEEGLPNFVRWYKEYYNVAS
jgi:UDP-glucuronate 4-epimerase